MEIQKQKAIIEKRKSDMFKAGFSQNIFTGDFHSGDQSIKTSVYLKKFANANCWKKILNAKIKKIDSTIIINN